MKKNWFSIVLLFFTFIFIIYLFITYKGRNIEFYQVAEDKVPSVTKVLGERKLIHSSSRKTKARIYKQFTYNGKNSSVNDVQKYVKYLCKEESFQILNKISPDSEEGMVILQKKSFITGKDLHLKIKLENNKFTIFLKRDLLFQTSGITANELKNLLNYTEMHVITLFGNEMKYGLQDNDLHYILFKNLGVVYVFSNDSGDSKPDSIMINRRINVRNVNFRGAKPGMDFHVIINKIGKGRVRKIWYSDEEKFVYSLTFKEDGLAYCFISNYKSGLYSELYICLDE